MGTECRRQYPKEDGFPRGELDKKESATVVVQKPKNNKKCSFFSDKRSSSQDNLVRSFTGGVFFVPLGMQGIKMLEPGIIVMQDVYVQNWTQNSSWEEGVT